MNTQSWFRRLAQAWRRWWHGPRAPKPKWASPTAEARAAGWTQEGAGWWTHPALGEVYRERDGTWTSVNAADAETYDYATMRLAMWELAAEDAQRLSEEITRAATAHSYIHGPTDGAA